MHEAIRSAAVTLALLAAGCAAQPLTPAHVETAIPAIDRGSGPVEFASFIRVVARPELYHGRKVQLIGYMNLEFEGNGLYLSREQFEHGGSQDALWIDLSDRSVEPPLRRGWVLIEATFNAESRGHFRMFAGSLEHVTRLERWRN